MMLIELGQVPDAALPVSAFRDHLQLGSGFSDDGAQDAVLIAEVRAAIASVEKETGKALLERRFQYVVAAWRSQERQVLPLAPAGRVVSLTITDLAGGEEVVDESRYRLRPDTHAPEVRASGWSLPTIPVGGTAEIVFDAGFGVAWGEVPPDLAQAVMMLAAQFYEARSAGAAGGVGLPPAVTAICARYRPIRIFGGGAR